ncbi:hypothetical protein [Methylocystis suflitae]|uniref:hypothetical protein n=1 Tax=Methylocystis suflitae TaxID=2951405 RepID=UPI00210DF995|nr:hypothetical protein [Methylocystis suflitae]MCQ4188585.1 hypothetical protein [Methylocystis suflitae]
MSPEFERAVDEAAIALLRAMREDASHDDRERWADAALHTVHVHAGSCADVLPAADVDVAMCAIAGRARDLFADAIARRERLSQEARAFLIAEFSKLLDAETERVCASD